MPRLKNSKNLTDKQKKDYNKQRKVVIKKMPRTYTALLNKYYEENEIDAFEAKTIYAFMQQTTYSDNVLKVLQDFTENFLPNNQ